MCYLVHCVVCLYSLLWCIEYLVRIIWKSCFHTSALSFLSQLNPLLPYVGPRDQLVTVRADKNQRNFSKQIAGALINRGYLTLRNTRNLPKPNTLRVSLLFRFREATSSFFAKFARKIKLLLQWPKMAVHFAKLRSP